MIITQSERNKTPLPYSKQLSTLCDSRLTICSAVPSDKAILGWYAAKASVFIRVRDETAKWTVCYFHPSGFSGCVTSTQLRFSSWCKEFENLTFRWKWNSLEDDRDDNTMSNYSIALSLFTLMQWLMQENVNVKSFPFVRNLNVWTFSKVQKVATK